jgi:1-acyl-sn-glycerol-3-phosphate acyltransferase
MPAMPGPPPTRRPPELLSVVLLLVGAVACFGLAARLPAQAVSSRWLGFGFAGLGLGALYWHRFRGLGLIPPALTVTAVAAGLTAAVGWSGLLYAAAVFPLGVVVGRAVLYLGRFDRRAVWWVPPALILAAYLGGKAADLDPSIPFVKGVSDPAVALWLVYPAAALALFAWWALFRPFFELVCEPVLWLMYSVRGTGPGLTDLPARGPCLVIANHACWADPFFLAKVLPRPVTPVMTAAFYDKPVISWLMRRVIKAIRVPEKPLKQDVPQEIQEVIAALDRGECVVLFPEGYLRRSDEKPLRRFGRGVWQVLSARPETPVFPCWIEGGWGSYTSYKNGPPTRNKRPDFRRRIGVAVDAPVSVGPGTLAHHLTTRVELMNRVIAARKWLGLPDLSPFELPAHAGRSPSVVQPHLDRLARGVPLPVPVHQHEPVGRDRGAEDRRPADGHRLDPVPGPPDPDVVHPPDGRHDLRRQRQRHPPVRPLPRPPAQPPDHPPGEQVVPAQAGDRVAGEEEDGDRGERRAAGTPPPAGTPAAGRPRGRPARPAPRPPAGRGPRPRPTTRRKPGSRRPPRRPPGSRPGPPRTGRAGTVRVSSPRRPGRPGPPASASCCPRSDTPPASTPAGGVRPR